MAVVLKWPLTVKKLLKDRLFCCKEAVNKSLW